MKRPAYKAKASPIEYSMLLTTTLCLLALGVVMVFSSDGVSTYLYPDGRLLTDASSQTMAEQPPAPRAEVVRGTGYLDRQLSARGIELMLGRVTEAGLTEGCHRLRSSSSIL